MINVSRVCVYIALMSSAVDAQMIIFEPVTIRVESKVGMYFADIDFNSKTFYDELFVDEFTYQIELDLDNSEVTTRFQPFEP